MNHMHLPDFPAHLNRQGPRNKREKCAWNAWIKTATQAIRQANPRKPVMCGVEPEWDPPIFDVSALEAAAVDCDASH